MSSEAPTHKTVLVAVLRAPSIALRSVRFVVLPLRNIYFALYEHRINIAASLSTTRSRIVPSYDRLAFTNLAVVVPLLSIAHLRSFSLQL